MAYVPWHDKPFESYLAASLHPLSPYDKVKTRRRCHSKNDRWRDYYVR